MSFATLRKNVCIDTDIGTALKEIASNPHISDVLAFDLLDGRHIECAVTDIDDNAIRFDSVDCLGDDMIYGNVEKWLDCIDHLLPDELCKAIVDTERKHTISRNTLQRVSAGNSRRAGVFLYKEVYIMKFEQNPKRCYMCSKAFSQAIKPIPVIGGKCTPGYICPTCYDKLFRRDKQE